MMSESPRLVTYQQAADLLQVSDRTVWTLVDRGEIRAVRFGRAVRIDVRDLDDFIRRSKQGEGVRHDD
ncbi:MAG: helix-turn-helix domain-containing protein [Phycisphaerales bacterium]